MSYSKVGWRNNTTPALNATNLNHMDDGISTLYEKLGGGARFVEVKELVWENPNPNHNFTTQTIKESSDGWVSGKYLSDYNALEIHTNYNPGGADTYYATKIMLDGQKWVLFTHNDGSYPYGIRRVTATNSGIIFNSGLLIQGASAAVNDLIAVPHKIYGIKQIQI